MLVPRNTSLHYYVQKTYSLEQASIDFLHDYILFVIDMHQNSSFHFFSNTISPLSLSSPRHNHVMGFIETLSYTEVYRSQTWYGGPGGVEAQSRSRSRWLEAQRCSGLQ